MAISPHISVKLTDTDGDALPMIAEVSRSLRQGGVDRMTVEKIVIEALSGNYEKVLATIVKYVKVH